MALFRLNIPKTKVENLKEKIKLRKCECDAVKAAELGHSGAEVRAMVHQLRLEGVPICSSRNGYWMAHSKADVRQTINHFKSRIREMEDVVQALETNI